LLEEEATLLRCVLHPTRKENKIEAVYWLQRSFFCLNTGMRQDEILSLNGRMQTCSERQYSVKSRMEADNLNQKIFELLKAKAKVIQIGSKYVFSSEAGTKVLRRNLMRAYYTVLERAKIKDFKFHDLRHTFATRLAQAGIDLYQISKLLGHKDIKMTQRYAHHCLRVCEVVVSWTDAQN
jgi:integrase